MSKTTLTLEQKAKREELALFATYEIEAITTHLRDNLPTEAEYGYLRCMVLRILELNSAAMSVLGGEDDIETAKLRRVVEGH